MADDRAAPLFGSAGPDVVQARLSALAEAVRRILSHGGHWVLGGQIVTSAANLISTVLLLHALGLEVFGQFSLCFLVLMVVRTFLQGVILAPASTLGPRLSARSGPAWRGFLLGLTGAFAALSSLLLSAVLWALSLPLGAPWLAALLPALVLANSAACFSDLTSRYHVIEGRPHRACAVEFVRYTIQLSALALLAFGGPWTGADAGTALLILAVAACGGAATGLIGTGALRLSRRLSRALWPRFATFLRWMSLANLVETIQTLAPMFIGLALLGEAALGALRAISQVTNVLNLPTQALQQMLPTLGTKRYRSDGPRGLSRLLRRVAGWTLAYFALAAVTLGLAAPVLADLLFGETPGAYLPILMLFIAANLFIALRQVFSTGFIVRETPRPIFVIQGVSAAVATLMAFTAALWGPVAIAAAVASSTAVGMALCLHLLRREARHD